MAKTPAAARLLLLTTLLQLLLCCSTTGPLHIHLSLDGKIDPRFDTIKNRFSIDVKDLSKLAYVQKQITDKNEKHIRLYISGDFKVTREEKEKHEEKYSSSVYLNKKGDDVAKIVSKMIPPTAIGVMVFPITVHKLASGLEFLEEFEKTIQNSHKDLSVGRETIHLYFTLDDTFQHDAEKIGETIKWGKREDKLHSIAINKDLHFNKFDGEGALSGQGWSDIARSVYQVLIYEADTVIAQLAAKCDSAGVSLTVGGLTAEALSEKLFQVLTADNNLRHPYQKVITQLPNDCGTNEQRKAFTEDLINRLRKSLNAFGKEPSAVLYVCHTFCNEVENIINSISNKIQYYLNISNNVIKDSQHYAVTKKTTPNLDVKELTVEFHCHGNFHDKTKDVCSKTVDRLAKVLKDFLKLFRFTSSPPPMQIIFYACNVGTKKGLKYVHKFLNKWGKKDIKEVIAFTSWAGQSPFAIPMITVAEEDKFKASTVIDGPYKDVHKDAKYMLGDMENRQFGKLSQKNVNYAFGRFTVKVRKNGEAGEYDDFPVFPKTELYLQNEV